jgi:hypothetical protein
MRDSTDWCRSSPALGNGPGKRFTAIARYGRTHSPFTAYAACQATGLTSREFNGAIAGMIKGKHVIRLARGLYRLRGVV